MISLLIRIFRPKNYIPDSFDLSSIMARADFAVTAAGSIVFELVCLGTPQIAFIIDRNQEMMEALLFMVRLKKTGKLRLC